MFATLGFAEVLGIMVLTGIALPIVLRPSRKRVATLVRNILEVNRHDSPAVFIQARQAGALPWLLSKIGKYPMTTLDVIRESLSYSADGIFNGVNMPNMSIRGTTATAHRRYPIWFLPAIGVIGMFMLIYGGAGIMGPRGFAAGVMLIGLCGALCTLQATNDLEIKMTDGTKIVLSFATAGRDVVTVAELTRAADRINELAKQAERRD